MTDKRLARGFIILGVGVRGSSFSFLSVQDCSSCLHQELLPCYFLLVLSLKALITADSE